MRRIGILLAGCGFYDGSDVQETVMVVLALQRRGLRPVFIAPDVDQADVVDHTSGDATETSAPRRVLLEAARVTRGSVQEIRQVRPQDLDALVIPGGMGVVKNLCLRPERSFGGGALRPEVAELLDSLASRGAPVAALGLAEVILARHQARALPEAPMTLSPSAVVVDEDHRTLYGPGFLASSEVAEVGEGIDRLMEELQRRLPARPVVVRAGPKP